MNSQQVPQSHRRNLARLSKQESYFQMLYFLLGRITTLFQTEQREGHGSEYKLETPKVETREEKRHPRGFYKEVRTTPQREELKMRLEEIVNKGEYRLDEASVNVWNLDKDTTLSELLDKMRRAGEVLEYYILGPRTENEKVIAFNPWK